MALQRPRWGTPTHHGLCQNWAAWVSLSPRTVDAGDAPTSASTQLHQHISELELCACSCVLPAGPHHIPSPAMDFRKGTGLAEATNLSCEGWSGRTPCLLRIPWLCPTGQVLLLHRGVDGGCLRPGQGQVEQQHLSDRGTAVLPSWLVSLSMLHANHWQSLTQGHGTQMLVAHWELGFGNAEQQHCLGSVGPPERCCRQREHCAWGAAAACVGGIDSAPSWMALARAAFPAPSLL